MILEKEKSSMSLTRRCGLLGVSRSGWYYQPRPETEENLLLMKMLDRQYTAHPFYGVRRMTAWLEREGHMVNPKRVRRLLRLMGLEAIYPQPRLSLSDRGDGVYPYLLKGVEINRPNQVWCTDITYIPMRKGWVYLTVVMDWFSRYVLSWDVSVSMESEFCVGVLERALQVGTPEIFNSDQGSQYTSEAFTSVLKKAGVKISMDGRGRAYDNIFVERLWRSVKYEEVYLKDYQEPVDAREGLGCYLRFYNEERVHQSFAYNTPAEIYGLSPLRTKTQAGRIVSPLKTSVGLRPPSAFSGITTDTLIP